MQNIFIWVSESTINAAKASGEKCCPLCKPDGVPGYIFNANQWVSCFQCNHKAVKNKESRNEAATV